ncbi:MAG: carbon starvation protein A [Phycisphaerae bacterium]|nr:carbon starvation protein A [Phycisphaerae bacterium]
MNQSVSQPLESRKHHEEAAHVTTLLIAVLAGIGFLVAYYTYGRWLGRKIFRLAADHVCPSESLRDDVDFVPTKRGVIFGHHFTSIAGTGPIVGPAIAVMWGWLPALLWVFLGSIFIGAVHDLGSLVVSLRNNGQTIGDVAGRLMNQRVRLLFLLVLLMGLTIVLAIFGLVIAIVFRMFPEAIFPCVIQIPIAIMIGLWLNRRGYSLVIPSLIALVLMYLSVIMGDWGPLASFNQTLAEWPTMVWVFVLLSYSFIASILPVGILLQPRDYINALQLISSLGLVVIGLIVAAFIGGAPVEIDGEAMRPALELSAPVAQWDPIGAPMIFPFLFVTIACGAISGFHCLVASGTSSKQLARETDAQMVGYGSMITEGFLATIVILACVAGIGLGVAGEDGVLLGKAAWSSHYTSWSDAKGLSMTVGAFVDGSSNFLKALGIPPIVAIAFMGVLVASFAGTTLDTACRLQRYVIQELWGNIGVSSESRKRMRRIAWSGPGRFIATGIAVVLGAALAALPSGGEWTWASMGTGGIILWPLFGATNQLLAGLAFLVIAFYLWRRNRPIWFLILPMILMLVIPMWAMIDQIFTNRGGDSAWWDQGRWELVAMGLATCVLEIWMIIEAILLFPRTKGLDPDTLNPATVKSEFASDE